MEDRGLPQGGLAQRAAVWSLVATTVVVAVKFGAAYKSHSISVLAEGLQSTVDILMSFLAVATLRYVAKPADEDHPYGHGKAELLSSAFQMVVVILSGVFIVWQAYGRLLSPQPIRWDWGAGAMAYTLLSNSLVGRSVLAVAKRTKSAALASEALHLRGDSLACLGVLVGMVLVGLTGEAILDPVMAIVFACLAMLTASRQLRNVLHPLMDGSLPPDEVSLLEEVLQLHSQVRGYHKLRAREVGSLKLVELHVMLDDALTFAEAHEVAEDIEREMREALGGAVVNIHYEPFEAELAHQARDHRAGP